jgi:predicted site-specific integrase-resolvase
MVSARQAALRLGISVNTVIRYVGLGTIAAEKERRGGRTWYRIPETSVEEFRRWYLDDPNDARYTEPPVRGPEVV